MTWLIIYKLLFSSENDSTFSDDSDNSESEIARRPKKRPKLNTHAYQLSDEDASKHMRQKLSNWKIVQCVECYHYARHPDAIDGLDIDLIPKDVSVCLSYGCKHKCMHMSKKLANLLIISCTELRHIHSQKALNMEEVNIGKLHHAPFLETWVISYE